MELINKLFIIAFSVFCFYFDFVAYKEYKAIAVEVKEEGEIWIESKYYDDIIC